MGFPGGSDGKESSCNVGDRVPSLSREDPLEKGMVTHSSILAWRIPWRVGHDWATNTDAYRTVTEGGGPSPSGRWLQKPYSWGLSRLAGRPAEQQLGQALKQPPSGSQSPGRLPLPLSSSLLCHWVSITVTGVQVFLPRVLRAGHVDPRPRLGTRVYWNLLTFLSPPKRNCWRPHPGNCTSDLLHDVNINNTSNSSVSYSCLENPMDRGAWRATVHGVAKRRTRVKQLSTEGIHLELRLDGHCNGEFGGGGNAAWPLLLRGQGGRKTWERNRFEV